jgi:hypothetical protein
VEKTNRNNIMAKNYYIEDNEVLPAVQYCETKPEGYTLITDQAQLLKLTMQDYYQKEKDGKDFYNNFRSRLMLGIKSSTIVPADAYAAELHLADIKDNLISGNWMTASYLTSNKALAGIFTQELKDEILAGINGYIAANY